MTKKCDFFYFDFNSDKNHVHTHIGKTTIVCFYQKEKKLHLEIDSEIVKQIC